MGRKRANMGSVRDSRQNPTIRQDSFHILSLVCLYLSLACSTLLPCIYSCLFVLSPLQRSEPTSSLQSVSQHLRWDCSTFPVEIYLPLSLQSTFNQNFISIFLFWVPMVTFSLHSLPVFSHPNTVTSLAVFLLVLPFLLKP